jgi:hypothetical protein
MSSNQLSAVLVNALLDEGFCQSLLHAPDKALTDFELTADELHALSSIRASTIEEFADGMARWLSPSQPANRRIMTATPFASI